MQYATLKNVSIEFYFQTKHLLLTSTKMLLYHGRPISRTCFSVNILARPIIPTLAIQTEQPFVGDTITFTCKSEVQRWPGYFPSHLSYHFIGNKRGESNNNRLTMNKITKLDKGTIIACQATDDLGKTSTINGPENVVIEPAITNINVTEGTTLGPIYCLATCNPGCKYNWTQNWTVRFNPVPNKYILNQGRGVMVQAIKRSQTGIYRCRVDHSTGHRQKWKDISSTAAIYIMWLVNMLVQHVQLDYLCWKIYKIGSLFQLIDNARYCYQDSPNITDIWFSSNNQNYGLSNPTTFNFNEELHVKMTLRMESKPRNATAESDTVGAKVGTIENIELHVISFPAPTVTWIRVTSFTWKIQKDRYDYSHSINSKINIRSKADFGVYGINICNQLGCIVENITLKPQDIHFTLKQLVYMTANLQI
ncbi:hypothetical protein AM593_07624, partial [Mytilus galloprovincialis]